MVTQVGNQALNMWVLKIFNIQSLLFFILYLKPKAAVHFYFQCGRVLYPGPSLFYDPVSECSAVIWKSDLVLLIPPKHFQGSWQAPYWAGPAAWRFVFLFPNFWCDAALLTSEFSRPVFPLKCLQCVLMSGRCLQPIFFRIISTWFERRYFKHISLKLRELNEQYIKQINVDGRLQGQDPPGENGPWPAFQLERYPFKQLTRRECWKLSKTKVDQNIDIVLWHANIVKTIDWKVPAASQKHSAPKQQLQTVFCSSK